MRVGHRSWGVWFVVVAWLATAGGCSDDEQKAAEPLAGAKAGTQRYVVWLKGAPPDATEYKKALAEDPETAVEIAAEMQKQAIQERKRFVQALKAFEGRVVDHWWLSNAVTVEIPAGNSASLETIDGVERVEPDQLLQ